MIKCGCGLNAFFIPHQSRVVLNCCRLYGTGYKLLCQNTELGNQAECNVLPGVSTVLCWIHTGYALQGPYFAPPYEPLPKHVRFIYDGAPMDLSLKAEEAAGFFAKMLDHEYTKKRIFCDNFFQDWRKVMKQCSSNDVIITIDVIMMSSLLVKS